jgi:hypothetical protein
MEGTNMIEELKLIVPLIQSLAGEGSTAFMVYVGLTNFVPMFIWGVICATLLTIMSRWIRAAYSVDEVREKRDKMREVVYGIARMDIQGLTAEEVRTKIFKSLKEFQ